MTKAEFTRWAQSKGWVMDKYGHLQKEQNGSEYRYKMSDISVRREVKVHHEHGGSKWMRLKSQYFSKLSVNSDGLLVGMQR